MSDVESDDEEPRYVGIPKPEPNAVDVDIYNWKERTGALWKIMVKEGEGDFKPEYGMLATIRYVGTVWETGCVFEDTQWYGQPFEILINGRGVLKAFNYALPTMKRGEKAVFIAHHNLAFGKSRRHGIERRSTVKLEVELLGWEDNLGPTASSGYTGKIIRERMVLPYVDEKSRYNVVANVGAFVKVSFEGQYEGKVFDSREKVEFFIGDGFLKDVPVGINIAIRSFIVGEKSRLTLDPQFAFGNEGHQEYGIPPNSVVEYLVELHDFCRVDEIDETTVKPIVERLHISRGLYEVAKQLGERGLNEREIQKYEHIIICLNNISDTDADQFIEERLELLSKAHLALGARLMEIGIEEESNREKVFENISLALEYKPESVEAWRTLGRFNLSPTINDLQEALKHFSMAETLDPDNEEIKAEVNEIQRKLKNIQIQEKELAKRMLGLRLG